MCWSYNNVLCSFFSLLWFQRFREFQQNISDLKFVAAQSQLYPNVNFDSVNQFRKKLTQNVPTDRFLNGQSEHFDPDSTSGEKRKDDGLAPNQTFKRFIKSRILKHFS